MKLSVVIPSYMAGSTIRDTLDSIFIQRDSIDGEFDVTVVDSSPADDMTREIVTGHELEVNFVHLPEKAFPGKARNRGVDESDGDVICFIDADAVADSTWLKGIQNYLTINRDVQAVGGPVLNQNTGDGYSFLAHWCEFSGYGNGAPEGKRRVQPTVNVAIRRDAFLRFGPFLENQFGNEDVLLFHRLIGSGDELHFSRKIRVFHKNKSDLESIYAHQYRLGESTGRARVTYDLPGNFLTSPALRWMVPYIKTHFIGWRILTQERREYKKYLRNQSKVFKAMREFSRGFNDGVNSAIKEKK